MFAVRIEMVCNKRQSLDSSKNEECNNRNEYNEFSHKHCVSLILAVPFLTFSSVQLCGAVDLSSSGNQFVCIESQMKWAEKKYGFFIYFKCRDTMQSVTIAFETWYECMAIAVMN